LAVVMQLTSVAPRDEASASHRSACAVAADAAASSIARPVS
jgi:hypothetical protein